MSHVRPAESHETLAALQRVFQYLPQDEALNRLRAMVGLMHAGGLEQPQLLVQGDDDGFAGAILFQELIGRIGIVWPPQMRDDHPDSDPCADALVRSAIECLQSRGIRVIQSVQRHEEEVSAAALLRNGFRQLTQLVYMRHELELGPDVLCAAERLRFCTYQDGPKDVFHRLLLRSYEQTSDFPELNGRRTLDEILAGLQAVGFDPGRWWLAIGWGGAVGVLALNEAESDVWELAYVGVSPEARRKGWGRELVRKALFEAKAGGAHELILSVDARNQPALQLYRSLGFESYDRRSVYLLLD